MPMNVALIIGFILAVIATVAVYIFVIPESRRQSLNKALLIIHNIFTFKKLLLESILRFLYTFLTIVSVCVGFFMLFSVSESYRGDQSMFVEGLIVLIVSPIVLRITFEMLMLKFIEVKNVIDINKKMTPAKAAPRARRPEASSQQQYNSSNYNSYNE